jgi:hypothetical protein
MTDQKQPENVEYFNYFVSMINAARSTGEIKSRIATAKAAFNKKTLFHKQMNLNLRRRLVKCYIWSMYIHFIHCTVVMFCVYCIVAVFYYFNCYCLPVSDSVV